MGTPSYDLLVLIHRCPRCRAEDISADAHPVRVIRGDRTEIVPVCRSCYRAAELEYRLACNSAGIPYATLPIREGLFALAGFYEKRLAALDDPDLLLEDDDRRATKAPVEAAFEDVRRRLAIEPVRDA